MTLPVPPGADPAATAAVLAGELAALAALAASLSPGMWCASNGRR